MGGDNNAGIIETYNRNTARGLVRALSYKSPPGGWSGNTQSRHPPGGSSRPGGQPARHAETDSSHKNGDQQ